MKHKKVLSAKWEGHVLKCKVSSGGKVDVMQCLRKPRQTGAVCVRQNGLNGISGRWVITVEESAALIKEIC